MDVLLKKGLQSGNFRIFFEFTLEVCLMFALVPSGGGTTWSRVILKRLASGA